MRLIGELEHAAHARTFSDYLTQQGIENQLAEEFRADKRIYEIWVHSEDDVQQAEVLLNKFLESPDSPEYQGVSRAAQKIKKQAEKEAKERPAYVDARTTIFNRWGPSPNGVLTILLIVACIAVAIFSRLGESTNALRMLFITDVLRDGSRISWLPGLPEITIRGEIWRLFTPIFIHFGIIHLVFNMMWLRDLGNMVEDRKGRLFFAVFILVVAAVSNLTQYLVSHPLFGGMSGVIYGLLGYIWMKGKYDPASRLFLHKSTVTLLIFWFFFCLTGFAGNVANGAHAGGLLVGIAWGYLTSGKIKQHLRKLKE
jgi:GlpG protein